MGAMSPRACATEADSGVFLVAGSGAVLAILRKCTFENEKMRERQAVLMEVLPRLADSKRLAEDVEAVRANATVQHVHKKHWPCEDISNEFRDVCKLLRTKCDTLLGNLVLDPDAAVDSAKAGAARLRLAAEIDTVYDAAKTEQGVLDFDDLLICARRLLTDPAHRSVREDLAQHNTLLLVDECQDTDPVQVDVVKALCGDRRSARASCSSWATTSSRSTASAGPIRAYSASCASRRRCRASWR